MAIPVSSSAEAESVDVVLDNLVDTGLLKPSVARIHRLSAMLEDGLLEEIGSVDDKYQTAINSAIKNLFGLN